MIIQVFKQIWAQRKSNIWLFMELFLVGIFLWIIVDKAIVDIYTYIQPKGFDSSHVYQIKLGKLQEGIKGYIPNDQLTTTDAEDLYKLMEQIRLLPEVESIAGSFYSMFYTHSNSYNMLVRDTANMDYNDSYRVRRVTPEFFDVFQIRTETGEKILPGSLTPNSVVISGEIKEKLFGDEYAIGQPLIYGYKDFKERIVTSVCNSIRNDEYSRTEPNFFICLIGPEFLDLLEYYDITNFEVIMRVNPNFDKDYMDTFISNMGERATVNNLYVTSIIPFSDIRSKILYSYMMERKTQLSFMAFILLNVFFGIIATFWLRTGYRRGEIGLRMALGASSSSIFKYLFWEGTCLLAATFIPLIFVTLAISQGESIETERLPFTVWRYISGIIITYLLMFIMIVLGILYPAKRSAEIDPSEALHYE